MNQGNLLTRDDTMFGVCAGLGEDFGFNPNWLRVALGVLVLWSPLAVIAAYVAAGVLVAVSRLLAPNPRVALPEPAAGAAAEEQADAAREPLPIAA